MKEEDALITIVNWLRSGSPGDYSNYGYDLYLPNVIRWHLIQQTPQLRASNIELNQKVPQLFPLFANAAWELCRRGILRPGVNGYNTQATPDGSAGSGFSVTLFGQQWLSEDKEDTFIPTEPERFAQLLKPFAARFGDGFHERAQQAVRCYGAHAYLACCAMCGAAAESILLAAAIVKKGDEASHGRPSNISDNEAYTSLAMLLRYSMFVNKTWDSLTK